MNDADQEYIVDALDRGGIPMAQRLMVTRLLLDALKFGRRQTECHAEHLFVWLKVKSEFPDRLKQWVNAQNST